MGSMVHYITGADPKHFQPANITFDLLPQLEERVRDKQTRQRLRCGRALAELDGWNKNYVMANLRNVPTLP